MKKKRIRLVVFTVFSMCLAACGSLWNDSGLSKQVLTQEAVEEQDSVGSGEGLESTFEESAAWTDLEQERLEREEQERLGREQRKSALAAALYEKLSIGDSEEEKAAFVEWLLDACELDQLERMDFSEDINKQLYYATGKSLHVLWDVSLGYLENENTGDR